MIKVRVNFETNSSSEHSLVLRTSEGAYAPEEALHSDDMDRQNQQDCILVTSDEGRYTEEELRRHMFIRDDGEIYVWSRDFCYQNSAMQVLDTFFDKLCYLIAATYCNYTRHRKSKTQEILDIISKINPEWYLKLDYMRDDYDPRRSYNKPSVNGNEVIQFMKQNNVSVEDFLTMKKYIVIVCYEEFCNMKFLNMVDMDKIVEEWYAVPCEENKIVLNDDGIWELEEGDITFGRAPFRVLGSPEGKARYALASSYSNNLDEVVDILQEVIPDLKGIKLPEDEYSEDGVDHGYCEDCAMPNGVSLREFILNKKYVIVSDGDEYCVFRDFSHSGLRNLKEYPVSNKEAEDDYDY